MKKKMISLFLIISMIFSTFLPNAVFANAPEGKIETPPETQTIHMDVTTPSSIEVAKPLEEPLSIGTVDIRVEVRTLGEPDLFTADDVPLYKNDTAASVLGRATAGSNIHIQDNNGYVSSIEKDGKCYEEGMMDGEYAGWMHSINNEITDDIPPLPKDGDLIRWHYTIKEFGKDIIFLDTLERMTTKLDEAEAILPTITEEAHQNILDRAITNVKAKLKEIEESGGITNFIKGNVIWGGEGNQNSQLESLMKELDNAIAGNVYIPATNILISQKPQCIKVGEKHQFTGTVKPDNATNKEIQWKVVEITGKGTITENGLFTATQEGMVIVQAHHEDLKDGAPAAQAFKIEAKPEPTIEEKLTEATETAAAWIEKNAGFDALYYPTMGTDWNALGLARYGKKVSSSYEDSVLTYLEQYPNKEDLRKKFTKSTDFSRIAIAMAAIGHNPTAIGQYNFIEEIYNNNKLESQGVNGLVYGLIALDTYTYAIPADAKYTKEHIIEMILQNQHEDGGFGLGSNSDIDITGMVIQGLSTYYDTHTDVKRVVDRALNWLSSKQETSGGFSSGGTLNCESVSQVICALTSLGRDPLKESEFIKSGNTLFTALMRFYNSSDGGFKFNVNDNTAHIVTTQQGLYTLVSYKRMLEGATKLYDMSDALEGTTPPEPNIPTPPKDKVIAIPEQGIKDAIVIAKEDDDKNYKVLLPENIVGNVVLDLTAVTSSLPQIVAKKGNLVMQIEKGTSFVKGAEVITVLGEAICKNIESILSASLDKNMKLDKIDASFEIGGKESIAFDKYITLTIKNMGDKESAYIDQEGKLHFIKKIINGMEVADQAEYCYQENNDLVIKTKHFTDFIAYTATPKTTGGGDQKPSQEYVNISVNADTIGKGDLYSLKEIALMPNDTPYTVLKRIGLNVDAAGSGNNIYVTEINGLSEFQHGPGSGWMYCVNGSYPQRSAGAYKLRAGDVVEWQYTTNFGEDIGGSGSAGGKPNTTPEEKPELKPELTPGAKPETIETDLAVQEEMQNRYSDFDKISKGNEKTIKKAIEIGIITGYGDTLKPQQEITRAEFIAMLVRMLKLETAETKDTVFKDVSNEDWFGPSVYAAYNQKLIAGVSKDYFMPHQRITYEEVAVILQRIISREVVENPVLEDEGKIADWAKNAVFAMCSNQLMKPEDNKFRPKQMVSREMSAVFLVRILESGKLNNAIGKNLAK